MTLDSDPPEVIDTLPYIVPIKTINKGFYQGEIPSYLASWGLPSTGSEIDPNSTVSNGS